MAANGDIEQMTEERRTRPRAYSMPIPQIDNSDTFDEFADMVALWQLSTEIEKGKQGHVRPGVAKNQFHPKYYFLKMAKSMRIY